jgi:ubiquitin C-terminal hydrolase
VGLPRGCCGIRNQGNTCYQNTAIQLLCCVPELVGALLGQQAVQLLRTAAADAANNRSKSSIQHALLVAAAAAQAGIAWLPKATVGPALQQLVCEMWGFQQLQDRSQRSSPSRRQPAQRPQGQLQEQQQQLQRVTACMAALREAMAELDLRWDDGDQWDCQEFALTLLQTVHVSWQLVGATMAMAPAVTTCCRVTACRS